MTPSCIWKYLKRQVDWVAETVVMLVHHHRRLVAVVPLHSSSGLFSPLFSHWFDMGFSADIPKSVP